MDLYSGGRRGSISKYFFYIEFLFLYQCASTSIVALIVKNAKTHSFAALQKNLRTGKKIYKSHINPIIGITR